MEQQSKEKIAKVIYAEGSVFVGRCHSALVAIAQCIHDLMGTGEYTNLDDCLKQAFALPADTVDQECIRAVEEVWEQGKRRYENTKIYQFRSFTKYSDGKGNLDKQKAGNLLENYTYLGKDSVNDLWGHFYFGKREEKKDMKLLLIAGHGGNPYDPGATANGVREADLTRDFANHLVLLCRDMGMDIDLYDTTKNMVQTYKNGGSFPFQSYDLCLEIHFNASGSISTVKDGILKGTMFYTHGSMSDQTRQLAQKILMDLIALGSTKAWDGLVPASVQYDGGLLVQNRAYASGCEHLLLETAFVSDADDVSWFQNNRDAIVYSVASNLAEYAGITPPTVKYTGMVCNVPEGDILNVRTAPADNAAILSEWGKLSNGNIVDVLEDGEWKKIKIAGKYVGFVYGKYIVNVSVGHYIAQVVNVPDGDHLNVRISPKDGADILPDWPYLSNGNVVEVLGEVGNGWDYVRIGGRSQGYVYGKKYLKRM